MPNVIQRNCELFTYLAQLICPYLLIRGLAYLQTTLLNIHWDHDRKPTYATHLSNECLYKAFSTDDAVQKENIVRMIRPDSGCAQVNFAQLVKNKVAHHGEKPHKLNKEHAGILNNCDVIAHLYQLSFEINKKTADSGDEDYFDPCTVFGKYATHLSSND